MSVLLCQCESSFNADLRPMKTLYSWSLKCLLGHLLVMTCIVWRLGIEFLGYK